MVLLERAFPSEAMFAEAPISLRMPASAATSVTTTDLRPVVTSPRPAQGGQGTGDRLPRRRDHAGQLLLRQRDAELDPVTRAAARGLGHLGEQARDAVQRVERPELDSPAVGIAQATDQATHEQEHRLGVVLQVVEELRARGSTLAVTVSRASDAGRPRLAVAFERGQLADHLAGPADREQQLTAVGRRRGDLDAARRAGRTRARSRRLRAGAPRRAGTGGGAEGQRARRGRRRRAQPRKPPTSGHVGSVAGTYCRRWCVESTHSARAGLHGAAGPAPAPISVRARTGEPDDQEATMIPRSSTATLVRQHRGGSPGPCRHVLTWPRRPRPAHSPGLPGSPVAGARLLWLGHFIVYRHTEADSDLAAGQPQLAGSAP